MHTNCQDCSGHTLEPGVVHTEFLIVGAGPAGASLACFLGAYGKWHLRNPTQWTIH
jgi:hypothetical protein